MTVTKPVKPSRWTLEMGSKEREHAEPEERDADVTLRKLLVVNFCRLQIVEL